MANRDRPNLTRCYELVRLIAKEGRLEKSEVPVNTLYALSKSLLKTSVYIPRDGSYGHKKRSCPVSACLEKPLGVTFVLGENMEPRKPIYYGNYLQLDKLLDSQHPESKKIGSECHDEMLFIVVHQVYELWFKQMLHEFRSIYSVFKEPNVAEKDLSLVVAKLERIKKIQGLLLDQLEIMETMTPMDFLEFRDLLVPASGFQSVQFREIEIILGLGTQDRIDVDREFFLGRLAKKDQDKLLEIEKKPSFLKLLEGWLERVPFTVDQSFDFWTEYNKSVETMLKRDEDIIRGNESHYGKKQMEGQLSYLDGTRKAFESLFNKKTHDELISKRLRKFSQKATLNALFIFLYRDEPILNQPFRLLTALMDIDENFTTWRYRHSMMAHRMLGSKIGTGGSSGHEYLKRAAENNRVFVDLYDLSTFLIPRSLLPVLPEDVKRKLDFHFS